VHYEFVPQGQIVNKHYYVDSLRRLRENVRRNRPEDWNSWDYFLRYYTASVYSAFSMRAFMAKGKMIVVPYPTFSPDLVPCDFFLLPELNIALKGGRFNNVKMVQSKSREALVEFHTNVFRKRFEQWSHLWV
jgi:hypothetical protein